MGNERYHHACCHNAECNQMEYVAPGTIFRLRFIPNSLSEVSDMLFLPHDLTSSLHISQWPDEEKLENVCDGVSTRQESVLEFSQ